MEELNGLVEKGAPIVVQCDLDGSQAAITELLNAGYVQVQLSGDGCEKGDENYSLFIQVERPGSLAALKEACESGKEVLISLPLAEEGADLLNSFGYQAVEEELSINDNGSVLHFRKLETISQVEAAPHELVAVEQVRGGEIGGIDGWTNLRCFQEDSAKQKDQQVFKLEAADMGPKLKSQEIRIQILLLPSVKREGANVWLRMEVMTLNVGVVKKQFENGKQCLGFFPDSIELSLQPEWLGPEALVPVFAAPTIIGPSVKRTRGKELSGTIGYSGNGITAKMSDARETQEYTQCIDCSSEGLGTASYTWSLKQWENGRPYNNNSPFPFGVRKTMPKLPFPGSTPALRRDYFPEVAWIFPPNTQLEDIKFNVQLQVSMRLVSFKTVGIMLLSPYSTRKVRTFPYHFNIGSGMPPAPVPV